MIRLLLIALISLTTLLGDDNNGSQQNTEIEIQDVKPQANVLYLSYVEVPSRVIKGEIFSLTIKALSTVKDFKNITYKLSTLRGLKLLRRLPFRQKKDNYYLETFYFLVTSEHAKLPTITGTLEDSYKNIYKKNVLESQELTVIKLNPKDNFSNIVAKSFELQEYKTTSYDSKHNIIIFVANAQQCYISSFKLQNVYKQGVESINKSYINSKITYFVIIDKKIKNFSFTYFNTVYNKFTDIAIPIIVDDDSVTTQTDLKPKNQSREQLKMAIAAGVAVLILIFILWTKKYIYIILFIFPTVYIIYTGLPSKIVCVKKGSSITLLPVSNSTIFEITPKEYRLQKEGQIENFIKVKLKNSKIGWVKNEDICSN
jgi:hypothetical protein